MRYQDVDGIADHLLMQRVREGDIGLLGTLFERYSGTLFHFFQRMTSNSQRSEDLVQDVFFRILKYRHTYRDQSRFSTWMYQIARNVCMDDCRKRRNEVELDDEEFQYASADPLPGEGLERDQDAQLVRCALAQLPPDRREVLVLSRFQGLKYEQIAGILGCEVGAVKVRIHRAVGELRDRYLRLKGGKARCDARK